MLMVMPSGNTKLATLFGTFNFFRESSNKIGNVAAELAVVNPVASDVNTSFATDSGEHLTTDLIINGNTRTTDKVIRRQLSIAEGDSYSKYLINYSKNKIERHARLGF